MPKNPFMGLKDIFGRGGYAVHSPGTFKPATPSESGLQRRQRKVVDPFVDAAQIGDAQDRQHRKYGNTP